MSAVRFIRDPSNRLDVVAGLIDGILNALTLAAGRLVHAGGAGATLSLALRVSVAAGATTIFVFFIAHYAQLRLDLIRHKRELNFTEHGRLAATRLGHRVFLELLLKAMLASGFSVVGALFPLILCAIAPSPGWLGLAVTILALSGLGALLARTITGRRCSGAPDTSLPGLCSPWSECSLNWSDSIARALSRGRRTSRSIFPAAVTCLDFLTDAIPLSVRSRLAEGHRSM